MGERLGDNVHIQQSDGLGEKAIGKASGFASNAPVPPARRQQSEQTVVWVGRVFLDSVGPSQTAVVCNVLDGRKWRPNYLLRCPHHSPHCCPVCFSAASRPDGDAVCQYAL